MSEQQAGHTHGESGSIAAEAAVQASSPETNAPVTASGLESETPEIEAIRKDADAIDVSRADAAKLNASFMSGRLLVKAPGKRGWQRADAGANAESEPHASVSSERRPSGMAAVVALAVLAGAISGGLATAGVMRFAVVDAAIANGSSQAVEASVARIDADIVALKAGLEHATKNGQSQFNKANDRLDKIEKAQAEPAAKLAKLSEAVDRLRTAPAAQAAATTPAARDITGSVTPPAPASATAVAPSATSAAAAPTTTPPKTEVARLPTVDGWTLRDVSRGGALIEGREGLYEVYAGDPVPGLGRVDAIRKQDGRWVVVTSKGLVVAR